MTDDDPLAIPDFLRRPPPTPEQLKRIARLNAQTRNPTIKIRNPRKRFGADVKLLGLPQPAHLKRHSAANKGATTMATPTAKTDKLRAMRETGKKKRAVKAPKPKAAAKIKPAKKAGAFDPDSKEVRALAKDMKNGTSLKASLKKAEGGVRPGSKLEIVVGLLKRPGGCTTADILAATKWPSVSVPQQARAAGLTLAKEKVDGITRYSVA